MKKIDLKKESQKRKKKWDVQTLRQNFGGLRKLESGKQGLKKELFFKFSFTY